MQTIDIAPTLINYFGLEVPADVQGLDLADVLDGKRSRDAALFGIHGGHLNVTDGRHVYLRAPHRPDNAPLEHYTLMPTHMRRRFDVDELAQAELAEPFGFTKGVRTLRLPTTSMINPYAFGTLLFDLESDPQQQRPIIDPELELRMAGLMVELMRATEAPKSQFERMGLPFDGPITADHLLAGEQADRANAAIAPLPPLSEFAAGKVGLDTPIAELLAIPEAAEVLDRRLPQLQQTELITAVADLSIYRFAASTPIPRETLAALADDLATIAPPTTKDHHDERPDRPY